MSATGLGAPGAHDATCVPAAAARRRWMPSVVLLSAGLAVTLMVDWSRAAQQLSQQLAGPGSLEQIVRDRRAGHRPGDSAIQLALESPATPASPGG